MEVSGLAFHRHLLTRMSVECYVEARQRLPGSQCSCRHAHPSSGDLQASQSPSSPKGSELPCNMKQIIVTPKDPRQPQRGQGAVQGHWPRWALISGNGRESCPAGL